MNKLFKLLSLMLLLSTTVSQGKTVSLYLENDFVFHEDLHYTHGTKITYMHNKPTKIAGVMFDDIGISLMQMLYTPDDLKSTDLITNDRPYSGILGVNLIGQRLNFKHNIIQTYELTLGIIGKYSFAKDTQKGIHKLIDCTQPKGWHNQLPTEPIINIEYRLVKDVELFRLADWLYVNAQPGVSLQVGNWQNDGELFLDLRLGSKSSLAAINHGITQRATVQPSIYSYWLFAGLSGKSVWHSTQLDGNVFRTPTYHVKSENFVGELHYGAGFSYRRFTIQLMHLLRTREFTIQESNAKFGALVASWQF